MSKSTSHTNTPEGRLAEALVAVTPEGVDYKKIIEQIPEAQRPEVRILLSGIAGQIPDPGFSPVTGAYRTPAVMPAEPADTAELVKSLGLEEGFSDTMETQRTFQLLRAGQKAPDFGQVLKIFTPEMLARASELQNPQLTLITPDRSFNDLVSAMDGHKTMPGQNNTYVGSIFRQYADQKSENWGAYIIESPEDVKVQDFDNTDLILKNRLTGFADHKKATGVNGMDRWKFAHAMMQALKEGRPIDVEFWTMLDEDPAMSDSRVPDAYWDPGYRQVYFDWSPPGLPFDYSRFRRSVGGDVPNS